MTWLGVGWSETSIPRHGQTDTYWPEKTTSWHFCMRILGHTRIFDRHFAAAACILRLGSFLITHVLALHAAHFLTFLRMVWFEIIWFCSTHGLGFGGRDGVRCHACAHGMRACAALKGASTSLAFAHPNLMAVSLWLPCCARALRAAFCFLFKNEEEMRLPLLSHSDEAQCNSILLKTFTFYLHDLSVAVRPHACFPIFGTGPLPSCLGQDFLHFLTFMPSLHIYLYILWGWLLPNTLPPLPAAAAYMPGSYLVGIRHLMLSVYVMSMACF